MASSNLAFEFSRRWREIGARLFPQASVEQREAISMLEQNMRDLEDAWPTSGGGGTGAIGSAFDLADAGTFTLDAGTVTDTWSVSLDPPDGVTGLLVWSEVVGFFREIADYHYLQRYAVNGTGTGHNVEWQGSSDTVLGGGCITFSNSLLLTELDGSTFTLAIRLDLPGSQGIKQTAAHMRGLWLMGA